MNDGTNENALVISDNDFERQLIETVLGFHEIPCCLAASQAEAAQFLNSLRPRIIIVSWRAEGLDGRTIVCQLKQLNRNLRSVPVILITDRKLNVRDRTNCRNEGINWIVQSPLNTARFATLVKMLIDETITCILNPSGLIPQGSCPELAAVNA
jgi:DNA-binding response OmpR family regulator